MAIDEKAVIEAVAGLGIAGDDEGMIPAFGLYLTRHMADYYNRISYAAARKIAGTGLEADARALLVEAGHVCAFNTFGGIMKSAEWEAVVKPMIEDREDWIRGMTAIVNAFGWGRWSIQELVPGEKLRIKIEDSYEAVGWNRDYPSSDVPRCYLAAGGVAGLMNLLYVGDITAGPTLNDAAYVELFKGGERFEAEETQCLACGHGHCEFVATRVS